jgi:putative oxidoreductase
VVLGAIFFYHGYAKLGMGSEMVSGFFASIGIPAASFFAPLVTWAEMLTGIALILGLFTHWAAKIDVIIAIVAFVTVHMNRGFDVSKGGYEFIVLIFASSVMIMVMGAGRYSIDAMIHKKDSVAPMQ